MRGPKFFRLKIVYAINFRVRFYQEKAMSYPLQIRSEGGAKHTVWTLLSLWFLLALAGSLLGAFQGEGSPPVPLGLMATVPVLLFAGFYLSSAAFRHFVLRANPRILSLAQSWRVLGVVFVILYYRGLLPAAFALPAGYGDIAIGVTAPLIAWAMSSQTAPRRQIFILWNWLGILDLIAAIALGILNSNSSLGILVSGVTTRLMGSFPLSLVPTFLVPLFFIAHVITLIHLRQQRGGGTE
jgi:hypothetical protein